MPNVTARGFFRITGTPPNDRPKKVMNFVVRETLSGLSQLVNEPRRPCAESWPTGSTQPVTPPGTISVYCSARAMPS